MKLKKQDAKTKIRKQLQSSKARKALAIISMSVVDNIIPHVQGAGKTSIQNNYVKDRSKQSLKEESQGKKNGRNNYVQATSEKDPFTVEQSIIRFMTMEITRSQAF
jgi:hypothetical protein